MKRTGFKIKPRKPLKRTKLRIKGISSTSELKDDIQAISRKIVIVRDGGCILRNIPDYLYGQPPCNGYRKDGELILQADHLISRSNNATYADTRLIVCLCKGHHGWKSVGSNLRKSQYDAIVKKILSKERVELWEKCESESWKPNKVSSYDWKLAKVALEQELKLYET